MKVLVSLGILAAFLAVASAEILELNDVNFSETVKNKEYVMIEFFSPKCPYCKAFAPAYADAAKQLATSQPSLEVATVDCTSGYAKIACSNIKYVPWVVMYHKGKQIMTFGNRTRDVAGILQFVTDALNSKDKVQDMSPPNVQAQNTCDLAANNSVAVGVAPAANPEATPSVSALNDVNFDTFVRSYPYVIVDYYTPWCSDCAHLKPLYEEAAKKLSETTPSIKFAKVDCNQGNTATFMACRNSQLKFYPWVVLYHDGRPQTSLNMESVPDTNTIYNFINKNSNIGGVMELDDTNFDSTVSSLPYAVVNFYAPWCFYCKKMAPIYDDVAKEEQDLHPEVRLIKVDCSATNEKTKTICGRNEIAFLPTVKVFSNGQFLKEYEGDKTKKDQISGFISDVIKDQQQSLKRTLEEKKSKAKEAAKKKDQPTKKSSKDKTTKDDKKQSKKKDKLDAAKILKNVFKQFKKKKHHKKSKLSKHDDDDDDDDDDDEDDRKKGSWQQVAKDIHHIAKDIHRLAKEFHKNNKQPAVDRMVKAFKKIMKSKDTDEEK